ncbi:hypothetical protein AAHK20_31625 [Trinickia sp. YCB016]
MNKSTHDSDVPGTCSVVPSELPMTCAMASNIAAAFVNTFLLVLEVGPLRIDHDRTVEATDGWYFYYSACSTDLTPLQAEALRRAWPVFVDRVNGSIRRRYHPSRGTANP